MNANEQSIPELDASTVFEKIQAGEGVILDVREVDELQQVSLSGAVHIPLNELPTRTSEVPTEQDVFVLCHVGQRSAMATQFLREAGHDRVWNVRGGIIAWLRARLPAQWSSSG